MNQSSVSTSRKTEENPILNVVLLFWKYSWLLFPIMVLMFTGAWFFTKKQTKIYEAKAQLIIELTAPRYLPYRGDEVVTLGSGNHWNTREFFETQFRIIRSHRLSQLVVDELKLREDIDFLGLSGLPEAKQKARLKKLDPARILRGRIHLEPIAESHVVYISVRDSNPQRAALLANSVARNYREMNVNHKVSAAQEAVLWLQKKVDALQEQRRKAAQRLLEFKQSRDLLQSTLAERQHLIGLTLQDAERQLLVATRKTETAQGVMDQVRQRVDASQMLQSPLIQKLKQQRLEHQNARTELLNQYLEDHPKVQVIDSQLKRIEEVLTSEYKSIRRSLRLEYEAVLRAEQSARRSVEEVKREGRKLQSLELDYQRLERDVHTNDELYNQMQVRLKEAELQAQARANNVRILDQAMVSLSPVFPRLSLNLVATLAGWLLISLLLVLLLENLDRSLKSTDQLESEFGLTCIGSIPLIQKGKRPFREDRVVDNPDRYILENPNSVAAEAVRTIRTNLLFMDPERELRSLLVTSAAPREGKTSSCANIGVAMAAAGSRILLVDSDLRRPRLHHVFGISNAQGLTNLLLNQELAIEQVVCESEFERLDILCSGPLPPNPVELLQSRAFRRTLDRLLSCYDRVVFDSPPVVPVTDAQVLGHQLDGTILIVRANQTPREMIARATDLLRAVNVNLLGALLNGLSAEQSVYGHYYYRYQRIGEEPLSELEKTIS